METISILELSVVLIGISGWISFFYLIYSNKPKLKGTIISMVKGTNNGLTAYMLYPYIANQGNRPIYIVDFLLSLDIGVGYIEVLKDVIQKDIPFFQFYDNDNNEIKIPDWPQKILYNNSCVAEFGNALNGFLLFKAPIEYFNIKERGIMLTCIDSENKKHKIFYDERKTNNFLFQDVAGVKFFKDYHIPLIQ